MGFKINNGVRNTPWGEKCNLEGGGGKRRGVRVILYWQADAISGGP